MKPTGGRRVRVWLLAAVAAIAAFTLAACDGDGDDVTEPPSTTTEPSTTSSSTSTSSSAATTTSTSVPGATTTTDVTDPPPPKVTGVKATTGGGSGETQVTWDPSPDADVVGYRVYRSVNPGGPFEFVIQVTATLLDDVPGNHEPAWYYRVAAIDAAGQQGPRSGTVCAEPAPNPPAC